MIHQRNSRCLAAYCLALLTGLTAPGAAILAVEITSAQVGFDGGFKLGHWTDVTVTLQADTETTGQLVIEAVDGEHVPCRFAQDSITVSPGESTVRRHVRIGRAREPVTIRFTPDDVGSDSLPSAPLTWTPPFDRVVFGTQQLVLVLGADVGIEEAMRLRVRPEDEFTKTVVAADASSLPESWIGYDSVDVAILSTGDRSFCEQISATQWVALEEWIALGGKLVLAVGSHAEELLADGQPLSRLIPGRLDTVINQRETNELKSYAKSNQRIDPVWRDLPRDQRGVATVRLLDTVGREEAIEGVGRQRAAWIIHSTFGMGTVTFVACDLDTAPIAAWAGRTRLVSRLVGDLLGGDLDTNRDESGGEVIHLGFRDLAGQLRASLDQFSGVRVIPFSLIAALAAAYILWIGPIDYFLLRRFAPKMEWTWGTFPLAVVVLSVTAVGLAHTWKGDEPQQNVAELIDVDPRRGTARCQLWSHLYCADAGHYNIGIRPRPGFGKVSGSLLAWQGLPGRGLGGMQSRAAATFKEASYTIHAQAASPTGPPTTSIRSMPVPTWSSRSLNAVWWSRLEPEIASDLVFERNQLRGEFRNPLEVPVLDAALCYGRMVYQIGKLGPEQLFLINDQVRPRSFRYRLTRRRKLADDKLVATAWSKEDFHIQRIMEMMMFHDKAGGRTYTDLLHRFHGKFDLSRHLESGTAILYGRLPARVTDWRVGSDEWGDDLIDDRQRKEWTYCRILFPVTNK